MFTTTTQRGLILGTAAYMSPEHVRGQDPRSPHRHLGVRLHVLRGAHRASRRSPPTTVSDTLAAVLREEPDWRALSPAPLAMQRLIKRCLKKEPQPRLHDIADAGLEIDDARRRERAARRADARARPVARLAPHGRC